MLPGPYFIDDVVLTGDECPEQTDSQSVDEVSPKTASEQEKGGGNAYAFCMITNYINFTIMCFCFILTHWRRLTNNARSVFSII